MKTQLFPLILLPVLFIGCGDPAPRFQPDPRRGAELPESPEALIQKADALMEEQPPAATRIDEALAALQKALQSDPPAPFAVHWRLAKANFLMTETVQNEAQSRSYAVAGKQHAEKAKGLEPDRVEPHYYLALNVAKIAKADNALGLLKVMLEHAQRAAEIDPSFDDGGPHRFMGKVYLSAPAWPISVGSAEKGVEMLEQAVKLAPTPLNRLFLGEAYFKDDQYKKAHEQLTLALEQADSQGAYLAPQWRKDAQGYLEELNDEDLSDE